MKILLAGDIHGDLAHSQYLVRTAKKEGCQAVFVCGDWGYWEHTQPGVDFCDRLDLYCNINNIPTYFLDGNHDKTSLLVASYHDQTDAEGFMLVRPYLRYAGRGHRWTWDGVRFIALGGAWSVDKQWRIEEERRKNKPESLWFPEEEMSDDDMAKILVDTDPVDVMLAHDKPRGSNPGWNRKDLPECVPNQDRLQLAINTLDPKLFFHGHLHYSYRETYRHSLVGSDDVGEVTVIGLDCNAESAESYGYSKDKSWWVLDTEKV